MAVKALRKCTACRAVLFQRLRWGSFFVFAVLLVVFCMFPQIRVWSCLLADNFGLFTEIAVRKFVLGLAAVWPEIIFIFSSVCVYIFVHRFVRRVMPRDHAP